MVRGAMVTFLVVVMSVLGGADWASAEPAVRGRPFDQMIVAPDGSRILRVAMENPRRANATVYSVAMRRPISVTVLVPKDQSTSRPSLYLLDGIDGGLYTNYTQSGWTFSADAPAFMADKDVNVVLPIGGTASYYTDWLANDPVLGRNKWETFLSKELPPLIDARFEGNGVNAIGGLSMGALGAMSIAVRNPTLYSGVAAFSGCMDQSAPVSQQATASTILTRGGNPNNMWGPLGDLRWEAHDPAEHIQSLRGKPIYVSVGNGTPDPRLGLAGISTPSGGAVELLALECTRRFKAKADRAGVSATYDFRPGVHTWPYWSQDLHRAWPTLAKALKVPA